MLDAMRDLYQEVILDHNKRPRNFRKIAAAPGADGVVLSSEGFNPLCGDRLTLYLRVDGDRIADAAFEGSGCAISKSSASMMTEAVKGRTSDEADALFAAFHDLVTHNPEEVAPDLDRLGKLAAYAGVWEYPARVKCASLPWHTLRAALHGSGRASTE